VANLESIRRGYEQSDCRKTVFRFGNPKNSKIAKAKLIFAGIITLVIIIAFEV